MLNKIINLIVTNSMTGMKFEENYILKNNNNPEGFEGICPQGLRSGQLNSNRVFYYSTERNNL